MINIKENIASKVPGETSVYVSFDYRKDLVTAIKSVGDGHYDSKTHTWEFPATALSALIEVASIYDDVDLTLLKTEEPPTEEVFELADYKTKPFEYQLDAIQKGLNHDKLLLLADPGLGKTLMSIYIALERYNRGQIEHCLIICGVNTLKYNWKSEILRHSDLSCKILGERQTKSGRSVIGTIADRLEDLKHPIDEFFVITNIETIRDDSIVKEIAKGKANKFDMIIVDELHKCKSPTSQQGKNLLKLGAAPYLLGLSGTILVNSPLDLYVPLKWIGANHSAYNAFKFYYASYTGNFNNILVGYKHTDVLKDALNKYALRQTKDLLNLPAKNVIHELVEMDLAQAKLYTDVKKGIANEIDKIELNTTSLLSLLTRLRQVMSCPGILTTENVPSSKVDRACDLAEDILASGEKVIIYSIYKDTVAMLAEKLKAYSPKVCTGDTKDTDLAATVELFQTDPNTRIILATPQKLGTGITLTAARYVIFVDCLWTAAENQQAEDRIYRIGSDKPVFIYYLWNAHTIDYRVRELVENKGDLFDMMVNNKTLDTARLKQLLIEDYE